MKKQLHATCAALGRTVRHCPRAMRALRRPARLVALAAAGAVLIGLALLTAAGSRSSCEGPCPQTPASSDGAAVSDRFWFVHQGLGPDGSVTVRLADMTGTITYPPPDHDEIVPGLVPWAKTGIILKDGLGQGSDYAALMLTGEHGVRFQYGYTEDVAGPAVEPGTPVWLRLDRDGDRITASTSMDGQAWEEVGTAVVDGLPETVEAGMFATSPGDLTVRETAWGAGMPEARFTQAVGVFDDIEVEGGQGEWASDAVGEMNGTDWERFHTASGGVEDGGTWTLSGTGDIGPSGVEGIATVDRLLMGLPLALAVLVVAAARLGASREPLERKDLAARAGVLGTAVFLVGLVAAGVAIGAGTAVLDGNGVPVEPLPVWDAVRIAVGAGAALGLSAVLAFAIGAWLRRKWTATVVAVVLIAVPLAVGTVPLLPDAVSEWLLRTTPAAVFALKQAVVEYPQVTGYYVPSAGFYPLPGWAGTAVLLAYLAVAGWLAVRRAVPVRAPRPVSAGVLAR
ncbi:hypothetical protein [Glycomyces sp. NPDC047010]|uniref:hypothetical protein n=1 Tax=Glycomyces sp. NPDC047010 TaxID=3155023 RepID=UPI00340D8AF4